VVLTAALAAPSLLVMAPNASATYGGSIECNGFDYNGSIVIHPGNAPRGSVAYEYLYVYVGTSQPAYTQQMRKAVTDGYGNWLDTSSGVWNIFGFASLPYHSGLLQKGVPTYFRVYENVYLPSGQLYTSGWWTQYDMGAFTASFYNVARIQTWCPHFY
jgi:hypothetical protein